MGEWKRKQRPKRPPDRSLTDRNEIEGVVQSVVFHSDESGYTVCSVKITEQTDTVTVVGNCPTVWPGELLKAEGAWSRHRRHGYQFEAQSMTCIAPTSARGIERYLASGMIRGIGKVMAKRLVKQFGDETLHIIEKESSRLEEVEGIGPVRRHKIKESWVDQHAVRDIMIFLQGHGVGTAQSARIYRHYGNKAIHLIRENPYRLCSDVWGIGFKTADSVAVSVGIPQDSEVRARAGLVHVLSTFTEDGHCFCPEPQLVLQAQALLEIPVETLGEALNHQVKQGSLVRDQDRIYLAAIHSAELGVAERITRLINTPATFKPIVVDKAVAWAEERVGLQLASEQAEALKMAMAEKVSIMTGGPGVGKTTIIRALVEVFKKRGLTLFLAAPTGRAAKRMEEATHHKASTIHRMLKFLPRTGRFEYNAANPVAGDVFILDEVSMIDIQLMHHFLAALPPQSCLVLVGDTDQLPSVGPGNVLRDLISCGAVPCTRLETIFRQESGGSIVQNAHRVNRGEEIEVASSAETSDFYFIEALEPDQVIQRMLDLVSDRIPARFGFDPMRDIQILTPMRRNQLGADNLNLVLQEKLNPSGKEMTRYGRHYRMGDRVMQIRNNYDKEVFNGDIGRIIGVDTEDLSLAVDFDGRQIRYEMTDLDELIHAYACSIHKSQGSEYPAVVILMTTQHFKLLQRNLLYTAITRGRKLVCLIGMPKAINIATRNNEIRMRQTALRERIPFPSPS